mgnify:FL=1
MLLLEAVGVGVLVDFVAVGFVVVAAGTGVIDSCGSDPRFGTHAAGVVVLVVGAMATGGATVRLTVADRPDCVVSTREAVSVDSGSWIADSAVVAVALGACAALEGADVARTVAVIVIVT